MTRWKRRHRRRIRRTKARKARRAALRQRIDEVSVVPWRLRWSRLTTRQLAKRLEVA